MTVLSQRAHDAITTSLLRQNDVVATSFWRKNDVIIASCARWICVMGILVPGQMVLKQKHGPNYDCQLL